MDWLLKESKTFKNYFLGLMTLILVAACGGSGGGSTTTPDSGGGTVNIITIALTISNTDVTPGSPATVTATVSDSTGLLANVVVNFTTTIGTLEPDSGTALTDAAGVATIILNAGTEAGAGTVTGTLSTGESDTVNFQTSGEDTIVIGGISVALGATQISAGGTTTVTATVVDGNGAPFTQPVDVNFSSACSRLAIPTATISSPIAAINGVASSTYLAQGCVGDDVIDVSTDSGGVSLSASATLNILSAEVGSIQFVSATPENVAIVGAGGIGGSESSIIVFRVLDTNGDAVNGQPVDFSLNTTVGGIVLNQTTATTNAEGLAQTIINSGTVATSVRVTASTEVVDPDDGSVLIISTQSSNLVVSTGIPDQDSFTLAADILNPEGWDITGTTVNITARLSDAFNNPVPDGTAVSFTTEGGSIEPSCTTVNGACDVVWTSQNPRPEGQTLVGNAAAPELSNTLGQKFGGRATILATAIGEESFPDSNGNGRFDAAEMALFLGTDISGDPFDLDEAFVDHNEDGVFNPEVAGGQTGGELETFVNFDPNGDSNFTQKDGLYNGVLCSIPGHAGCATESPNSPNSINVRRSLVLIMSGSNPQVVTTQGENLVLIGDSSGAVSIIVGDLHNQPMPEGTTVDFTTTAGSIVGPSSFDWPNDNHNGGLGFGVTVKGATTPANGSLLVEITTPGGLATLLTVASIQIIIPPDPINSIALTIDDPNVSNANPRTITATVLDPGGAPLAGELVTFTTTLATFNPTAGTALTNASGVATIMIEAIDVDGAGIVTGELTSGETGTVGYVSAGDGPPPPP